MPKRLKYLVIHCTATLAGREVSAAEIRRWHTSPPPVGNGWKQVGYTDLVHLDGHVERLVPNNEDDMVDVWEITNGVKGQNSVSRHVVYAGGLIEKDGETVAFDTRTPAQTQALTKYVLDFVAAHPQVKVAGHNAFAAKDCPSFDVRTWAESIGVKSKNIY